MSDTTITQSINVKYIYSACIKTTTPDVSIIHDPWFTEGIYDGSWFHFPRIENPLDSLGDADFIYVSHIHPDHYDSEFLKSYFSRYGVKKVLIADHSPNHLAGKMRADGITPIIVKEKLIIGNTTIEIVPHKIGSISDIDSAIIVKYTDTNQKIHCVVNANDIIFDDMMRNNLKEIAGEIDILLCGYTGAGPYPQTYFDLSNPELSIKADNKKKTFFDRYTALIDKMNAKVNIPFAGKYILGGKLADLNYYRGVADPVEVLVFDKNAVILADNGGEINTKDLKPTHTRIEKYSVLDIEKRIDDVRKYKMNYERLIAEEEIYQLPLKRLLVVATKNAVSKSGCEEDYYFCIHLPSNQYAVINANKNTKNHIIFLDNNSELPMPRSEIIIDARYLFGLLTNIYHWNNAEVGSQYNTRRYPDVLNRKSQSFLNYLAVN